MTRQVIDLGVVANDGLGDDLRVAGDKCNDNFEELYDTPAGLGPWGALTFGSVISVFGVNLYPSNEDFTLADRHRLDVEALVYRAMNTIAGLYIGASGVGGYNMLAQDDSNNVMYRFNSAGTQTVLLSVSANASLEHDSQHELALSVAKRTGTSNIIWGLFDGIRQPTTSNHQDSNVNLGGTFKIYLRTDDISKCYARARHLS